MIEYVSRLPEDKREAAYGALELLAASGLLPVLAVAILEEVAKSMVAEEPDITALRRLQIAHGVGATLSRLHMDAVKLRDERLASMVNGDSNYESVL